MAAAAERGEPWLTFFTPDDLLATLAKHHVDVVKQVLASVLWWRQDAPSPAVACRLVRASFDHLFGTGHEGRPVPYGHCPLTFSAFVRQNWATR
ncbi:hypothetical protein SAMN05421505_10339 [Sinosporangium album]|uniref:Uncharacterized protein n=1 Tax=Sinosporangium album TaxID=504805 RepID=A0A1G7T1K8_9ACTN|nr:hypothetical protein [Sinosporangium album]SDG28549.1 hypothetical protein SAMN05421505_10339 [Sinosporangium album]